MINYKYILVLTIFIFGCEVDNVGPLLEEEGIIFFMEDGIEISENSTETITIEVGAVGDGAYNSEVTIGGTATEGVDYTLLTDLSLDFPVGVYIDNIKIKLMDNENFDDDHTITLTLPSGQGYSENDRREFVVNIVNDDVGSGTVVTSISASGDDVEEGITGSAPGNMDVESSDLEFGETEGGTRGVEHVGLRFHNILIPQGAKVNSARIQFTVDEDVDNPAPVVMIITGEASAESAPFDATEFSISSRVLTNSSVEWDIPVWTTVGDATGDQRTVDFGPVVEEIVALPDWKFGNSINIVFSPTEATLLNDTESGRVAEAYDGDIDAVPVLTIDWEL